MRSEEHTSELQSQFHLVCRLLLEKKNNTLKLLINSLLYIFLHFFLSSYGDHRDLHSFPTRRSSDLAGRVRGNACPTRCRAPAGRATSSLHAIRADSPCTRRGSCRRSLRRAC